MKRDAEFYNDNNIGKIGEIFHKSFIERRCKDGWKLIDVSDIEYFRKLDIDQIEISPSVKEEDIYNGMFEYYDKNRCKNIARSYEVKTDTYISKTRNAIYELVVRDSRLGYSFKTATDFVSYVSYSEAEKNVVEMWIINMAKWRRWVSENEDKPWIKKVTDFNNEGFRYLLKCNIDQMVKDKVAKKVF